MSSVSHPPAQATSDSPSASKGSAPASGAGIAVQVLRDANALRGLSQDWDRLWRQTTADSAFQALEWILACVQQGAHPGTSCFAMVLRSGAEPLAIFPTQLSAGGTLSFIGAELSNYCGAVYAPGVLPAVMTAWRDAVSADPRIRSIDLTGLREGSSFLRTLAQT